MIDDTWIVEVAGWQLTQDQKDVLFSTVADTCADLPFDNALTIVGTPRRDAERALRERIAAEIDEMHDRAKLSKRRRGDRRVHWFLHEATRIARARGV